MLNRSGIRMLHYYRIVLSDKSPLVSNVRRYVALPQSRGGTRFCRLTVVLGHTLRLQIYRVGKNRDTRRETPAGAGADRGASHKAVFFSHQIVAPRRGNDIYRPVRQCASFLKLVFDLYLEFLFY